MTVSQLLQNKRFLHITPVILIILLAIVPLFSTFPYRVNIFLSWEGAYRISNGELPLKDFGTPLGGMYWVIPGIFFKIFGPQMITLIKAQVFINIISGLAFRSVLKSLGVNSVIAFVAILLYCLSFSFFNFWPWYNHTVIVYEIVAFAFLFKGLLVAKSNTNIILNLVAAAVFMICSFLTKQDAGAMAFLLGVAFVVYTTLQTKRWIDIAVYVGSFVLILLFFVFLFANQGFSYWFNHGQAPHSARISSTDLLNEFFASSQWIKFYIFIIAILVFARFKQWKNLWNNKQEMLFLLLTLGILLEAAVFQVTSYTPPDNNIFFHSFAIAYILYAVTDIARERISQTKILVIGSLGILLWWSGVYWKYISRIISRGKTNKEMVANASTENVVNKETYMINLAPVDTNMIPESEWRFSKLKSFHKIYMPQPTIDGMERLLSMDMIKNKKADLKVLNMSELTPLAVEIPFALESGSHYPLWYHLGVGMFNKQAEMFEQRIVRNEYDLVLFEYIPSLNNFYPFRVRDTLLSHYNRVDAFPAPRRGETAGSIEVYIKK
jgi:hypothetical protein